MGAPQAQGPLVKRYAFPAIALGILGGYLLSLSDYAWAGLAFGVCVILLAISVIVAKGERIDPPTR
jgi:uncharacterized membrane protein YfcA